MLDIPRATFRHPPLVLGPGGDLLGCQDSLLPLWLPVGFGPLEATVGDEECSDNESEV